MIRRWFLWCLVVLGLLPAGQASARLTVVATLPSLAALARDVGGPAGANVVALASPGEDPHFVEARPDRIVKLSKADLLVLNGLELEIGWLPTLITSSRNPRIQAGQPGHFDASGFVHLLEIPVGKIDRSMGDIHAGGNPHFLFDPRAGASIAVALAQRMAQLDPANAATYQSSGAAVASRLNALASSWSQRFASLNAAQRQVVTYHRSLPYLMDWLALKDVAEIEPRPGIPPDPGHVSQVLATMRSTGARAILQEEFYPRNTSQTLTGMTGARLYVIQGGAHFDQGQSYEQYITTLVEGIYRALST